MPTTICDAAALVPATATTQAHVHQCNRRVPATGFPHLGQHHCRECRTSFIVTPASAPTATEKCEACGAIQPMTNLREMYPEPDVTQYVCLDVTACSARVEGNLSDQIQATVDAHVVQRHPGESCAENARGECTAPLVEPQQDPAQAVEGLTGAIGIIRGLRDVVDDMARGTAGRVTLQRHLAQLERLLIEYRPPVAGELTEMTLEPGVVDKLDERLTELEHAVANLIDAAKPQATLAPPYVHRLLDALLTGQPIDVGGESLPLDVRRRLEHAASCGQIRRLLSVRTSDGRLWEPCDVQLVYTT